MKMLPSKKGQQTIKNIVFWLKMSLKSQVLGTYSHPQCQGFQTFGSARVCAEAYETSWIWNQICRQNWTHLSCCEVNLVCSFGISAKKTKINLIQWSNSHLNVIFGIVFCMSCAVQNREKINCLLYLLCDRDWKFVAAVRSNCERHLPKSSNIIEKTQRKLTTCIKIPGRSLALTVCNPASPSDIFLALSGSALLRRGRFLMYWSTASEWPGTAHQMMTIINKR